MKYHLYKRAVKKNGKEIIAWYYWFYDENKKQIRKSCGSNGKMCLKKRDAEEFIEHLIEEDKKSCFAKDEKASLTFKEITANMFEADSPYQKLMIARGRYNTDITLIKKTLYLKWIIEEFGDMKPSDVDTSMIENWLITLPISNGYKNRIIFLFNEIYRECFRNKIVTSLQIIETFKSNSKKKDILTIPEIKKLFPNDIKEMADIFSMKNYLDEYIGIDGEAHKYGTMLAIFFYVTLTTGLRSGEARALTWDQVQGDYLILNKMFNTNMEIVYHLKKGSDENPRARVVLIPERAKNLLNCWVKIRPIDNKSDYLFTLQGKPMEARVALYHFRRGLLNTGIIKEGEKNKKLTVHSLRFTYNTLMVNNQFPGDVLRNMIGHNSPAMTDYYTRFDLESKVNGLLEYKPAINKIWDTI